MIKGQHHINGQWHHGNSTFTAECLTIEPPAMPNASTELVELAAASAHRAFQRFAHTSDADRARLLRSIAEHIEQRQAAICTMAHEETALPMARLQGECQRTTDQLLMFADHIAQGRHLDCVSSPGLPERQPTPRPDIHRRMRPIGPVAVFGAANFPLAFSTAGGDTAAALAAGCPVVVKGHPAHPGTAELVAQAIAEALSDCEVDPGVFALIQDGGFQAAQQLVQDPRIKAVGFTGSEQGGRALFDLCAQRPEPIPFYGEMGSLNPVFVLPELLQDPSHSMARNWANSLTLGVGQFCTKPGLLVVPEGAAGDQFMAAALAELQQLSEPTRMLTRAMADHYAAGLRKFINNPAIEVLLAGKADGREVTPHVVSTNHHEWTTNPLLQQELFGPFALILRVSDEHQMLQVAQGLNGQLTATVLCTEQDQALAKTLLGILEQKAGRLIVNGFPTGVEVVDAMIHGGPYPASTCVNATSVGSKAIERFMKPVAYQNLPPGWLDEVVSNDG